MMKFTGNATTTIELSFKERLSIFLKILFQKEITINFKNTKFILHEQSKSQVKGSLQEDKE